MSMVITRAVAGIGALCLFLGGAACSRSDGQADSSPVIGHGSSAFPADTLVDWVSYADQVSVVTMTAEKELPPPQDVLDIGEGYIGRSATLQIEKTIWSSANVRPLEGSVDILVNGWVFKDEGRRPFKFADGPRMEVGTTYVVPLVLLDGAWSALTVSSVYPIDATTKRALPTGSAMDDNVAGKTVEEVRKALTSARPDPLAEKHSNLRGRDRINAVQKDKEKG